MSRAATLILAVIAGSVSVSTSPARPLIGDKTKGERIVFRLDSTSHLVDTRIAAVTLHDKKLHKLTEEAPFFMRPEQELRISHDGKTAVYLSEGKGPPEGGLVTFTIHMRPLDDRSVKAESLQVKAHGIVGWSPNGEELLIWHYDDADTTSYHLVDVKTKKKRLVPLPKLDRPAGTMYTPQHHISDWSPDGAWFLTSAGYRDKSGKSHAQMYMVKRDGSEVRRLKHIEYGLSGVFSPNGKRILFCGTHRDHGREIQQLYVADITGGKPVRVSQELNGYVAWHWRDYCWSPDGKRVAYVWHNGERDNDSETFLMVVNADGTNAEVVFSQKRPVGACIGTPNWR